MKTLVALRLALVALLAPSLLAQERSPPSAHTPPREIGDNNWSAAIPEQWNGRLLITAGAPDFEIVDDAALDRLELPGAELVERGWAVAMTETAPRATLDAKIGALRDLRDQIAARLGPPRISIVAGEGLLALIMAERHADEFHGFLSRNPRRLEEGSIPASFQPRGPLLIVSDRASLPSTRNYVERATRNANAESVVPVYWYRPVDAARADPQCQTLDIEAIQELVAWVETRKQPGSRPPHDEEEGRTMGDEEESTDGAASAEAPCTPVAPRETAPAQDDEPPTIAAEQ